MPLEAVYKNDAVALLVQPTNTKARGTRLSTNSAIGEASAGSLSTVNPVLATGTVRFCAMFRLFSREWYGID